MKKIRLAVLALVAAFTLGIALAACGPAITPPGDPNDPNAPKVSIKASTTLEYGAKETLVATVTNTEGVTPTWVSSDSATVSVSSGGEITGLKKGTAKITAKIVVDKKEYTSNECAVTVNDPKVTLEVLTLALDIGAAETLSARTVPANAPVTWASSEPSKATVSDAGEVKGVAQGTANITAKITVGGTEYTSAPCVVTVNPPGWNLALSKYAAVLAVGGSETVTVSSGVAVTWESSNADVAAVSSAGVITAMAPGYAFAIARGEAGIGKVSVWVQGTVEAGSIPISTAAGFMGITLGSSTVKYHLTQDIDFAAVNFAPLGVLGTTGANFAGTLDGNGYALKNIKVDMANGTAAWPRTYINEATAALDNSPADRWQYQHCTIFVQLAATGVIRNLNVIGIEATGHLFNSGLVGNNRGLIENCYVEGKITNYTWWYGIDCPGGMITGINSAGATVKNCLSKAMPNDSMAGFGNDYTWGLTGWNLGAVVNSFAINDDLQPAQPTELALETPAATQTTTVLVPLTNCEAFPSADTKFARFDADKGNFGAQWVFEIGKIPYLIKP